MTLGQHLREKRRAMRVGPWKLKLSIERKATLVPCSKSYLWAVENDETIPTLSMAVLIAKQYKTTLNKMAQEFGK